MKKFNLLGDVKMKIKKFKKIALVLFIILLIPTAAFAYDKGNWVFVDSDVIYMPHTSGLYKSVYGGDFKVEISNVDSDTYYEVELWEWDTDGKHDFIGKGYMRGSGTLEARIEGYVDDGNGAEIFAKFLNTSDTRDLVTIEFWD